MTTHGILGWGSYVPRRRLDRAEIKPIAGIGGGKGRRSAASYDEDSVTLAVAAGRVALATSAAVPDALVFATTSPPYAAKTNATIVHAALRLDREVAAHDAVGAVRSTMGALIGGLERRGTTLVTAGDLRVGRPGSAEESAGGDAGAAIITGPGTEAQPVLAELMATTSVTEEFLDRWRLPQERYDRLWEERFGQEHYTALAAECWKALLAKIVTDVDLVAIAGLHDRAVTTAAKKLGIPADRIITGFPDGIGNTGGAQPLLLLAALLERAETGQTVVLLTLADGADGVALRVTDAVRPASETVADKAAGGSSIAYGRYLAWRGVLEVEPPRRPDPTRVSASYAARSTTWKFGFEGSVDAAGGLHLPPDPRDTAHRAMSEVLGTIVTFTIDRLAYSPSPPVVFAVVDFDGGGRLPVELTDCDPADVEIGGRVAMTFRKLYTSEAVHNYFWKATLLTSEGN